MNLPVELKSQRKGLINIKNKDQKCFLWCHVRHINTSKEHRERIRRIDKKLVKHITNPEEIREEDKEFISNLDCDGIEFPVQEKDFSKIEVKCNICSMDLLLLINDDKSHYVYIKDFDRFMFDKIKKNTKKNGFVEVVYNVSVVKMC